MIQLIERYAPTGQAGAGRKKKSRFDFSEFTQIPVKGKARRREYESGVLPNGIDGETETYKIRNAAYALKPRPPIEYLIQGIIAKGSVNVLVGKFGSKKTWSAISAGVCVGSGRPWLGKEVLPGNVLIIDEESGNERLSRRLGDAIRGENGDENTNIFYVSLAQFNLFKNPEDGIRMADLIRRLDAKLVIIDALVDIMLGGDENNSTATGLVFARLRYIAETTGAAILIIHHANRAGSYRGSSAIPGAIDTMISVESLPESNIIKFKSTKVRDGLPFQFSAEAHWEEGIFYLTPSDSVIRSEEKRLGEPLRYVLNYLVAHDCEAQTVDIKKNANTCSPGSAQNAIYTLTNLDFITRSDGGSGGGARSTYKLTETGEAYIYENMKQVKFIGTLNPAYEIYC